MVILLGLQKNNFSHLSKDCLQYCGFFLGQLHHGGFKHILLALYQFDL